MEVVAFAHLRSYPSFPRQANSSLIAVEWNVARHTWVTSPVFSEDTVSAEYSIPIS